MDEKSDRYRGLTPRALKPRVCNEYRHVSPPVPMERRSQVIGGEGAVPHTGDAPVERSVHVMWAGAPEGDLGRPGTIEFVDDEPLTATRYVELERILNDAYDFAARGKGEERHGNGGLPWSQQRIHTIGNELGTGFAIGQAVKKLFESEGLDDDAAVREILGAITYAASAVYLIRQGKRHGK